jgi:hypothetical protein
VASTLLSADALASSRPARDTADVGNAGSWSVGVFNPLRLAVNDRLELEAHPLVFFVAPNLNARFALLKSAKADPQSGDLGTAARGLRLTGEVGLSVPTFGMRLLKGYLFPSWETSRNDIGWMIIPRVGLLVSGDLLANDVWTLRADAAFRVPLGAGSAAPLNSFLAPLEILLAAPLTGFGSRVGAAYDHALGDVLRLRGELNLFVTGTQGNLRVDGRDVGPLASISPFIVTAHVGVDIAVFTQSRLTIGAMWANYDQGATDVVVGKDGFGQRVRVRSNNFLPTIDYIWAGW